MRRIVVVVVLAVVACTPVPPAPPAPRGAMEISAPFNVSWNTAVDVLADRNVAIKTIDRSSGLIVAEPVAVDPNNAGGLADCGKSAEGFTMMPTHATWNLVVRGDTTRSTAKATVRFVRVGVSRAFLNTSTVSEECSSLGRWETDFEAALKVRAERKQ